MPTLEVVNFNIVCATLGGFVTVFGLVSYLLKEKFYLSEALISSIFGLIFSPHAANFIRPLEYANGVSENLETITLYFSRLVLGVQLVLAGVQLPSKYLKKEWKSLSIVLGPGMCVMWMVTSLLVWALTPNIPFLFAMAIGACVTPTDPILSNSIVKGKFADKNIPRKLQKIIIAESGANDGLGYPFLFLALYLLKYTHDGGLGSGGGGAGKAMALWFYEDWAYTILMSVAYGALVGWIAKELLHWAEERHYVDRESFLVFAVTLALFIVGTVGMLGSDDVLACFIAGNVFTWDDWFRQETEDDSLQPTIDMLLNVAVFMWYGAVCPWHMFVANNVIPIYRLIPLGILVLLLRRLPMILTFRKGIHQIEEIRHALFVGFFGPIGVSAIFYLYISRQFLREIIVEEHLREDADHLAECIEVIVWFLVICSITVHGLSIPLGKLGFYLPRTLSTAISSERTSANPSSTNIDEPDFHPARDVAREERYLAQSFRRRRPTTSERGEPSVNNSRTSLLPRSLVRFGRAIYNDIRRPHGSTVHGPEGVRGGADDANKDPDTNRSDSSGSNGNGGARPEISGPRNPRRVGRTVEERPDRISIDESRRVGAASPLATPNMSRVASPERAGNQSSAGLPVRWQRSIRFPDEPPSNAPTTARPTDIILGESDGHGETVERPREVKADGE